MGLGWRTLPHGLPCAHTSQNTNHPVCDVPLPGLNKPEAGSRPHMLSGHPVNGRNRGGAERVPRHCGHPLTVQIGPPCPFGAEESTLRK